MIENKIDAIKECIIDYSSPIFIVGDIYGLSKLAVSVISATIDRSELIIIGNKYPEWLTNIKKNSNNNNNLLIIKDFEKISEEEQKLFIDIICNQRICGEKLPEDVKILINSAYKCNLISDIEDVIQYFEL